MVGLFGNPSPLTLSCRAHGRPVWVLQIARHQESPRKPVDDLRLRDNRTIGNEQAVGVHQIVLPAVACAATYAPETSGRAPLCRPRSRMLEGSRPF